MLIYLQMISNEEQHSKFETLYSLYKELLHKRAYRILKNVQDAEDITHQTFLTVAEIIERIDEPDCPKTKAFLVIITDHKALDLYNKKQRHGEVPYYEGTMGLQVQYDGENELARCIAQLPERYRQIIQLRYYQGLEIKEIAKVLDLTQSNASKLHWRAKKSLEELCRKAEML